MSITNKFKNSFSRKNIVGNKKSSFNFPSLAKLEAKLKSWRDCSAGAGNQTSSRTGGKQESRETKHPGLPPPTRSVPDVVHSEDRGACHSQCPYCTCPCSSAGLAQAPVTPQPFGEVGKKNKNHLQGFLFSQGTTPYTFPSTELQTLDFKGCITIGNDTSFTITANMCCVDMLGTILKAFKILGYVVFTMTLWWCRKFTPRYMLKWTQGRDLNRWLYPDVHSSTMYKSQMMQTAQMSQ